MGGLGSRVVLVLAMAGGVLAPVWAFSESSNAATTGGFSLAEIHRWNGEGRSEKAEKAARALLKEEERRHGAESSEVGAVLDELSVALRRGGKAWTEEALQICERALRVNGSAHGVRSQRYAASLQNLGLLRYLRKDYVAALGPIHDALSIRQDSLGASHPDVAKSLFALASVQNGLGDFATALTTAERGVAIEEMAYGRNDPERVNGLNSLAVLRYSAGDYAGSITLLDEAIRIAKGGSRPNRAILGTCYHSLGTMFQELGDHEGARELLETALALRTEAQGASHPLVASTLTVLSDALHDCGQHPDAIARCRRALRIRESTDSLGADVGWARAKLGWLLLEAGDLVGASQQFPAALLEQERALGPDHPDLWMSLRGLAMVARRRGALDTAAAYYRRTLDLLERASGPEHPETGVTLAELASLQLAQGDSLQAFETALHASEINLMHLRLTAGGVAERQALLYTVERETGLDIALAALSGTLSRRTPDLVGRAWDLLVRSRALVLDETAERNRVVMSARNQPAGSAEEILEESDHLAKARTRLANLMVRGPRGEVPKVYRDRVDGLRKAVESAERALASKSAAFRSTQRRTGIGWAEVRSALPPEASLISFVRFRDASAARMLALVLDANGTMGIVPLGSADEIDRQVSAWRSKASDPEHGRKAEAVCRAAGEALRVRVWDPLLKSMEGATRVYVIPDGSLHLVNLSALPRKTSGYLVESDYLIQILSVERDLVPPVRAHRGTGMLVLGGASFDEREVEFTGLPQGSTTTGQSHKTGRSHSRRNAGDDCVEFSSVKFEPLPETRTEAEEVAGLWGTPEGAVLLTGRSAGERSVKRLLPGKQVAHLATHGFFLSESCRKKHHEGGERTRGIGGTTDSHKPVEVHPLALSGLVLAGANRRGETRSGDEDGILTADEIATMDLSGLDWVVLSACDTGVGEVQSGEGVLGLRRAFEVAGAGNLILSLWSVDDHATRSWMKALYEGRFRKGLDTGEAVRQASLGVLSELRAQRRSTHPFYWAAFVSTGRG